MNLSKKTMTMGIMSVGFLTVLSACGGGEGSGVTLYSPETPEMSEELAEAYEEEHGESVNVEYAGTNVLVNQMMAEADNPQADVWYGGGGFMPFENAVEQGLLESYQPEAASDWDVTEDDIRMRHEDWQYVGIELFALGFAYNPDLVSEDELPETWDDLLDERWEGELQMPNPAASGTSTLLVLSQLLDKGEDEGWEYFDELVEQMNAMPDSGLSPTEAVTTGEASIGIGFDFMAYQMKDRGETVDFHVPESTPVLVNPAAVVEDGPNPEGAEQFMEFLLSEEGQQIKADWGHIPLHPDVDSQTPLDAESLEDHSMDLDIDFINENYDDARDEWQSRYQ
ncbi:extracellular solute-binding protein [Salicibibacter cibi]|uniref:Extracellular solute-binding protein n=1 Tax=Salicibibacter cibi TaxID=2743001 RepID=A0A7T6ZCQ7_9BACI|nr:extracellular solute-binding protein [Salicibibacter cibi]QQK81084.1 extracellular solute-binding protein [Salicibibacter cibi]